MAKALPIKHIGIMSAICDRRRRADLRTDLGADRYKVLGVKERLTGEAPYRICPKCIAKLPNLWRDQLRRQRKQRGDIGDVNG